MNFNNGNDNNNNKNNDNYVRAVRGGKYSLLSFRSIYNSYMDCRKRKRGTINALRFEYDVLGGLFDLAHELQRGTYQLSRSVCFITRNPKLREIFAADFRDRIVHHLIVRELEKYWEPRFIFDSYACRRNKGIHAAASRLQQFMLKVSKSQKIPAYFIQLDIRSFFMSIDKSILFSIFEKKNIQQELLNLLYQTIFHDCTQNYFFRGNRELLDQVPAHKSLFKVDKGKGLPIGNLTSQFFANVYLNELDQFVKHSLKCRFYLRYVDDFLLLSANPEELYEWKDRIEIFLKNNLALKLKSGDKVRRVSEGADFLGYIIRPGYILVRRRVVNNLKYKVALFKEKMISVTTVPVDCRCFSNGLAAINCNIAYRIMTMNPELVLELRQVLSSYLGHFKHAQSHRLVQFLFAKHLWLNTIYQYLNCCIHLRYMPKIEFRSLRAQIRFFRCRLEGMLIFCRIGNFIEIFDNDAMVVHKFFGGKLKKGFRGMKIVLGFPVTMKRDYLLKAMANGYSVAFIEEGQPGKWIKHRYVSMIIQQTDETVNVTQTLQPSKKGKQHDKNTD
jgi:hypothetical protein